MMFGMKLAWILPVLLVSVAQGAGVELNVAIPAGQKVISAEANATKLKLKTAGKIDSGKVIFTNLLPDTSYDLKIELADGSILQGFDLSWYDDEAPKTDAGGLTDDDRKEIATIVAGLQPFMNHSAILRLRGNHDRAVALCEFSREKGFVNDKGDEVIWRVELWYFKYQAGGWEAVSQVNRIVRRERFKTRADYLHVVKHLKWIAELGGIVIGANQSPHTIELPAEIKPDK